jgi:hypothetical protein
MKNLVFILMTINSSCSERQVRILVLFLFILLASCDWHEKFNYRIFELDKADLLTSIDSLYNKHPEYRCPDKWTIIDSYSITGEFSSVRRFYFSSPNEEMYYVTISPSGQATKVIISAVHTNTGWHSEKDIPSDEIKRMEKRFDNSILAKLEILVNSKYVRKD